MFKKYMAIISAVLILALALTACGGTETEEPANTTEPAISEEVSESEAPEEPEVEIFEDAAPIEGVVYDDIRFTYTASEITKGEWEWFNAITACFGPDPSNEQTVLINTLKANEDSRVMITVSLGKDSFTSPEEASFDVGIQDTYNNNFGNFAQVRSSDVTFYDDAVIYTVDGKSILDIFDSNSINPDYSQLYVQFFGLTPEADEMTCDVTVCVVYPREKDIADETATYGEPIYSFTKEKIGQGEWNWFNAIFASYEEGYADLVAAIKTENSRLTVKTDLTAEDFDESVAKLIVGFQSTDDYSVIGEADSDDYEFTETGLTYSVSGERLLAQLENLGIDEEHSQFYVNFNGVKPESGEKTCSVTVEVAVPAE